jgi:hypothetical protein
MSDEADIEDELCDFSKDPCLEETWTETTLRGKCPKCKKVNYVNLGDLGDQTAPDREVCVCWNCGTKSWIIDTDEAECMGYESIDDAYDVNGTEKS